jgi:phycocyanobilin lyase subunit alpha
MADSENLTIPQAIANLTCEDLGLRFYAAWWLGKFRVREPEAIDLLIAALADEDDRTEDGGYPLRRNAARALGKLSDVKAVLPLIACLDCRDLYVREAAAQSLEMLQDKRAISPIWRLLKGGLIGKELNLEISPQSEPYDSFIEALGTLGATDAVSDIEPFLEHPFPRVRYAANRSLYQLTQEAAYGDALIVALAGDDLQLRRAALADLAVTGYLPAAEAIANTLAENSLKLISLKGLLDTQIYLSPADSLSDGAISVMALMDGLL